MSLQRYEHYYAGMDEAPDGEYVLLVDVIKLLEEASNCKCSPEYGIDYDNICFCDALALIKGKNK